MRVLQWILTIGMLSSQMMYAYQYDFETPTMKYLKPIEVTEFDSGLKGVDCIYTINLDERPDKWARMLPLYEEQGIHVNRVSGVNGWLLSQELIDEVFGPYPSRMRGGKVGCILSHLSVIKDAYDRGFDVIWLMQDDVEFRENVNKIPELLQRLSKFDPHWDVFYTDVDMRLKDGSYLRNLATCPRPDQKVPSIYHFLRRIQIDEDIMRIYYRYGLHSEFISRRGMQRILDYFSRVYIYTSMDIDIHYVPNIRQYSLMRDMITHWTDSPYNDTSKDSLKIEECDHVSG